MKKIYLGSAAAAAVVIVTAIMLLGTGENPPEESGPDINVSRELPDQVEEGETLTVTLQLQDPVKDSINIAESYSGVKAGEKTFTIKNSTAQSVSYYSVEVPNRTGELNFQGEVEGSEISGDSTVEVVGSDKLFIDLEDAEISEGLKALTPSSLGGLEKENEYMNDGQELVSGLEANLGATYGSGSETIYVSISEHNTTENAEDAVNRIARQQVEAGNREKVERVALENGVPALKVDSIEDRSIINWGHGRLVLEVQAQNPEEHAEEIEQRYQSWTE